MMDDVDKIAGALSGVAVRLDTVAYALDGLTAAIRGSDNLMGRTIAATLAEPVEDIKTLINDLQKQVNQTRPRSWWLRIMNR